MPPRKKKPTKASQPTALPDLGDTSESVIEFTRALTKKVESGELAPVVARELNQIAKTANTAIASRAQKGRLNEAREVLADIKEALADGIAYEDRIRRMAEEPLLGQWYAEVLPDGRTVYVNAKDRLAGSDGGDRASPPSN